MTIFAQKFHEHVENFLESLDKAQTDEVLVAVSGGPDSMALLQFAYHLLQKHKIMSLRAIHVHHHTRPGQDVEAALVMDFCESRGIELLMKKVEWKAGENKQSNFEFSARLLRYEFFYENLKETEELWLAHHLDDSFEWSMMQKLKSSNPRSSLGIPVMNGAIVRPFMCVSKRQVMKYCLEAEIPFAIDPTNNDQRYERNFIRDLNLRFKKRYPKYLKHYVEQQNFWAKKLGYSKLKVATQVKVTRSESATLFQGLDLQFLDLSKVVREVHRLSHEGRGQIAYEVKKFLKNICNLKRGPHRLSGGVYLYSQESMLVVTNHLLSEATIFYEGATFTYEALQEERESLTHFPECFPFLVQVERAPFKVNGIVSVDKLLRLWSKWDPKLTKNGTLILN